MSWVALDDAREAATLCGHCSRVDACLLDAMRIDAAFVAGDDEVGVTGVYAGVWFDQDAHPRPVGQRYRRRMRRGPSAAVRAS